MHHLKVNSRTNFLEYFFLITAVHIRTPYSEVVDIAVVFIAADIPL
jgi:hypothetical protein